MHTQPTIFLIDDDTDDQEIFSYAMSKAIAEAKCVFADDGIKALEKIELDTDFRPDYIFIDMNMPRMNGQQCLAEIKKIDRLKEVPVYMYSTSVDPESLEENKRLGAKDFIVKPSDVNDLVAILKSIIKKPALAILLFLFCYSGQSITAQASLATIPELKKLSVEELMNIVVTSVSRAPESLSEVASAIQVVTGNEIRRSTATKLPEALRLAPNLQVLQTGAHGWAVSARGFNGFPVENSSLANKLLVLIDGRTVYTPLFGGVYWDVQDVLLEDIDRIEVVSGPGGTLWGPNAINGVINITSKQASETQGFSGNAIYGSFLRDQLALRYGGQIDSSLFYRVYGQRYDGNHSLNMDDSDAVDAWELTNGGFRMDYSLSESQSFTLQGDLYTGIEDDTSTTTVNGQNLLARWISINNANSTLTLQTYFDRTYRNIRTSDIIDELTTFDLDAQYSFAVGQSHFLLIGAGYRLQNDKTSGMNNSFDPPVKTLNLLHAFIQDQITLVPERLNLTLGTKCLHNTYTGLEFQPSIRLAWTLHDNHTVWGAVSRAVRTPSRYDVDIDIFKLGDHPEFISEKLIAYEIGYRTRLTDRISISIAGYYNQYTYLRTLNLSDDPLSPYYFGNDLNADGWGFELSTTALVSNWWRLRGGYTYFDKNFSFTGGNLYPNTEFIEAIDLKHQLHLQSIMDISKSFELDIVTRVIGDIPAVLIPPTVNIPEIPAYINMNARLGWVYKFLTLSVAGQNLLHSSKREFGEMKIPRSVYAKLDIRL